MAEPAQPQENNDRPQIIPQASRVNNGGRTCRRYYSHKNADEIEFNGEYLKGLSPPNLRTIIVQLDIANVSDAVFAAGGRGSKVVAIMRFFRNYQRRQNNNNDEQQQPLQFPPNDNMMLNSDELDMNIFSNMLHNNNNNNSDNNNNNRNRNRNSFSADDIDEAGRECLRLIGCQINRNNNNEEKQQSIDVMEEDIDNFVMEENENENQNENEDENENEIENENNENQLSVNEIENEDDNDNNENEDDNDNNENDNNNENLNNNDDHDVFDDLENNRHNPILQNEEQRSLLSLLVKHGLQSYFNLLVQENIRQVVHITMMSEQDFRDLGITEIGTKWAFKALIQEITNSNALQPQQNINDQPQQNINPAQQQNMNAPQRPSPPTQSQLTDYMKRGIGCLYSVSTSTNQLKIKSGQVNHDFGNKTNNNTYRPIKHYVEPPNPIDSKQYKYSIASTTKAVIYSGREVGLVTVSDVHDPQNNVVNNGGHWRCKIQIKELTVWYNERPSAADREIGWNYMYSNAVQNGGYCDWWNFAALRSEPASVRVVMDWNNPPDFNLPIDLSGDRIDLRRMPNPFGN